MFPLHHHLLHLPLAKKVFYCYWNPPILILTQDQQFLGYLKEYTPSCCVPAIEVEHVLNIFIEITEDELSWMVCLSLNHQPFWHFLDDKFSLFYVLFYTKYKTMLVCFLQNNHHLRSRKIAERPCILPVCIQAVFLDLKHALFSSRPSCGTPSSIYTYISYATLSSDIL